MKDDLSEAAFLTVQSIWANIMNANDQHTSRLMSGLMGKNRELDEIIVIEQSHHCGIKSRTTMNQFGTATVYLSGDNQPLVKEIGVHLVATRKGFPLFVNFG